MKTSNKLNVLSGVTLLLLQTLSTAAHADYKGYWIDAVNAYQAQQAQHYQPQATYTSNYTPPLAAYDAYSYQADYAYNYESVASFDDVTNRYYTN
ncbi:hypothetical protein [Candidatus Thiothrix anitrata]|jgi:hypothetical protein|uniref:Secreted protein n=1 Tax=Candidatus Thiothrix anitrata TaxID=2823902 RepID=A0ABX7X508_9GAMM|nr:hypothetical protein [Candidatus Thiothrix anitrata]QTR50472.1 hypothetical protein J8380_02485 [Candidatus Thiothrix anitrata]